ncbi:MAG: hypothetical protein ACRDZO_22790 [Egibacteraceae bacterium]
MRPEWLGLVQEVRQHQPDGTLVLRDWSTTPGCKHRPCAGTRSEAFQVDNEQINEQVRVAMHAMWQDHGAELRRPARLARTWRHVGGSWTTSSGPGGLVPVEAEARRPSGTPNEPVQAVGRRLRRGLHRARRRRRASRRVQPA